MLRGSAHTASRESPVRVAVVHDFLYCYGGAERVLEQILRVFPGADLFSLFNFLPDNERHFIRNKPVATTFIQNMPLARRSHRHYLPLMPMAIEQLDVTDYDLVISSSYLAAKGVITRPDQLHVCYCHSPIRVAWDMQHQYLRMANLDHGLKSILVRMILHYIRLWDVRSANGVDHFIANSHYIARRIQTAYRRNSEVIYPPVDISRFTLKEQKENYYLTVSRFVPYKRIDLLVDAFARMPDKRLVVVGEGPDFVKIQAVARKCDNIELTGHLPGDEVVNLMQRARAFMFAAEEDFGIVPVEAQACGAPVIAYGRGGGTESVIDGETGVYFPRQDVESVIEAVHRFEDMGDNWDYAMIRNNAERFSSDRFVEELMSHTGRLWADFAARESGAPQCPLFVEEATSNLREETQGFVPVAPLPQIKITESGGAHVRAS
ncbi:MAG: glycosyltransferase family 4 protein [Planctomycetota bacterium]|jgi:glycosyltransferase involved in cell wall biosynthesis